ncbi:transcriptional regulator family: Fungal Specific TF and C2H2 zinc finger [Penicillium roqueforti]|uniref:transcriptional regulator family: C2H2 zinc finger and Fungal Specific TF n=1 Tax=Penicillium roqueforti TaxID=5082 RepID=UPI00190A382A|nr:transcriptional regulator family: C2H2 zinc finger and Fungal Specific TF [Penicillium roqueforti]KAF9248092.1 transcriptional regulator family: C2H2 zinc finger and Fungal Specific TF [Penicillium roqueforti]KAI2714782.1 transcriptional regulator family: C2H2 zinc finger and Fungal Specific TF [Penicillium roqueforti]KAI3128073.1 transcriptional regulator family: C2H2 zinc finger and Fungal Specific TF [Penicillium roqueforti]KAI3165077.1 transcriptional regulator family: C2H2 zinc finger a
MLNSKPYQCQRCPRAFARLEHLQRHDRSHTKEKPFVCVQCPKAFTRKDLLARHERLSHNPDASPASNNTHTTSPANPSPLDGLNSLASVVNHAQSNPSALQGPVDHFTSLSPAVHRPVLGTQLASIDTPSERPTTPSPGPDFGYALSGFGPASYQAHDFTSFLDSVPLPNHPFSPAYQPLPLFPPLHFSPVPEYDQSSDRGALTENTPSTPSSSVLPRNDTQLPSLQPEGYHHISPAARQPTGFVPVTAECREKFMNMLADYANVVPDPSMPSRHALSRCLTGYVTGFHEHYPIVHIPTFDVDSMTLPYFLAMAALGARYCREPDTAFRLYQIAKPVTMEHVRRVFQSGKLPPPGLNAADDIGTLQTVQALLYMTSVSLWFINNPPYHEALSLRSLMEIVVRQGGLNRLPEQDGTWSSWIRRECVKRTKLIVFCFFNIHTIVFDVPPMILTEDFTLELPSTEKEWQAPRSDLWQIERMKSPGEPKFQDALSALFKPTSNVERFSSLGGYVLIHAILQDIWLMTKAGRLPVSRRNRFTPSSMAPTPELVHVEQALERWCQCWERNQESSVDPLSPNGPLSFTSAALLRLAYIRLNADCGSARQLQTWDPVQIATSLHDNLAVRRGDRLTRAALHCAHALSTPVKLGIGFVAHSQVALWSNQHALCSLECAVLLAKWLEAITVPDPDPGLTEQETRLRDFVLEMVMEVEHGVSREWLLATNTRLSAAVTRLWARLFTADYIWEMVSLIGKSLNSYADLLEQ